MVVSFGSSLGSETVRSKLQELRDYLTRSGIETNGGNGVGQNIFLAEAIFSRAPGDYLERNSVDDLARVASEATEFYREYIRMDAPVSVAVRQSKRTNGEPCTVVLTAMGDRPFIVDTLTEILRSSQISHHVLLHPIIKSEDGVATSLTYLELDYIEDAAVLSAIRLDIIGRFADLRIITDDFPAILKLTEQAGSELINSATNGIVDEPERKEIAHLLRWLSDGGFLFLGYKEWIHDEVADSFSPRVDSSLGLFRSGGSHAAAELLDIERHLESHVGQSGVFRFSKIPAISPIHRFSRIDLITLRIHTNTKGISKLIALPGLLTSKALAQEAASIPLIRQKLSRILELEGLLPNSHDYKEIISIVNSMPKSDLLQYPVELLRNDIEMIYSIQGRSQVRARYRLDSLKHLISLLIVMPRERYFPGSRTKILQSVEQLFHTQHASSEFHTTSTDFPLYILHILLPNPGSSEISVSPAVIERAVLDIVLTWDDKIAVEFLTDGVEALRGVKHYAQVLPESYKASVPVSEARSDIIALEHLSAASPLELSFQESDQERLYNLKLYKQGEDLTMSAIVPYLENCGFNIVSERVTAVRTRAGARAAIYNLLVRPKSPNPVSVASAQQVFLPGLKLVLNGKADNDRLNELMLTPGLNLRQVAILRALTHYLWQIKASTSDQATVAALVENPASAALLVSFFEIRFDPHLYENEMPKRLEQLDKVREDFITSLKAIAQLQHDRTLRRLLNVIEATVRTNYFRVADDTRISLKIDCKQIKQMPSPRPFFEIFVCAPDFEGVHLRGGMVARGGLRWSDREDDYRTEVLGLMKTQMVKNAIIIPVGAKGGFVLRNRPTQPQELAAAVKACYSRFIRSMLEVTDNRVGDRIEHPPLCVIYDDDDPYFVVAADRGTATFSDVANAIAVDEFNFWLGDAFASGGSHGYDHKKLAITSRGVWETVSRHFREIGIDPEQQEFTVVGIGDMSGDVFGNGLLRSRTAKLIAAFDHRHIFIDPNPDPERSFEERRRLFELPTSKWSDYDPALISEGGGVYARSEKEITLSPQAQQALGISESVISGQALMQAVLRAPVDLLWNGGIGTFVKAADEENLFVGDRTNDDIRVDARELRVKIVGEGGNLGFTQLARIEYSKIGGRINTDAIDNSGGVNLSDLEVNLKILLSAPVQRKELSFDDRNALLTSFADEVCRKVTKRNRSQSCAISIGVRRSRQNINHIRSLLNAFEQEGILDRRAERLPDDETLIHRLQMKAGLTRPELGVLLGYTKMSLFKTILDSDIPETPFLRQVLMDYFPRALGERFSADVLRHPLKREIISTEVANSLVERMGQSFVFRSAEETGLSKSAVILACLAANAIVGADELADQLDVLDRPSTTRQYLLVLMRLNIALDNMTRWLLDSGNTQLDLAATVERYRGAFHLLVKETDQLAPTVERNRFREACKQLIVNGVPRELAYTMSSLVYCTVYLDIIEVSIVSGAPVVEVAKLCAQLYFALHIRPLLEQAADFESSDRWEESAVRTLSADVRRAVAKLTLTIIQRQGNASLEGMEQYLASRKETIDRFQATYSELSGKPLSVPALLVMTNQLFSLSRK